MKSLHFVAALAMIPAAPLLLFAQSAPTLDQPYTGSVMVSGKATPGQAPVTIYDTTNSTRTTLGGSQSVDKMGNFAAMLNAPLIAGHSLIVVDRSGATSTAMVVTKRPSSGSHQ